MAVPKPTLLSALLSFVSPSWPVSAHLACKWISQRYRASDESRLLGMAVSSFWDASQWSGVMYFPPPFRGAFSSGRRDSHGGRPAACVVWLIGTYRDFHHHRLCRSGTFDSCLLWVIPELYLKVE
ncbi:hypothetical protein B0F90DRAFT_1668010 [Multifurca ochricompacta]|uniref:Secreted protein n=1 Tax=Multifurca ochricompacta TaxID=376703 RepID=A0AAD4M494_9AGAM|nr:hypothetical protein B0F90DRAFT_1668010 [Multifurca ochricompacta]